MAHDTYKVNVGVLVRMPDYEFTGKDQYSEHLHNNKELKRAVYEAVMEQISNAMPIVVVNGEEFSVESISEMFDMYGQATEVHLNDDEQSLYDQQVKEEEDRWNQIQAELEKRERKNPNLFKHGVYSMSDMFGSVDQLDEVVHEGRAMLAITDGWDDDGPVYSRSVIENPTNWDMFKMFCEAVAESKDKHHIFLEGVRLWKTDDDIAIYQAQTGS